MKNLIIKIFIVLLLVSFCLINSSNQVAACTPIYKTPQQAFEQADAVFLGRVLNVATSSQGDVKIVTANVQIDKYWKGDVKKVVKVTSSGIYTCAPAFSDNAKGGDYLIYANISTSSDLYYIGMIDMKPVATVASEIQNLGIGRSPMAQGRFEKDLTVGSSGEDVARLQTFLEESGFLFIPSGVAKGYFGQLTRSALSKYQQSKQIEPAVGYFGPITRERINATNLPVVQTNETVQVYVNIVDKDGKPFVPNQVWWYYPPVNNKVLENAAKCANNQCTRWSVSGATGSNIYIAARYTETHSPKSLCFKSAYDAKPVTLSSSVSEITLTLKLETYCE